MADRFNADPFKQARLEVNNKSWDEQIIHSRLFHSTRSAFTSLFSSDKGSAASKGIGAAVGIGKLFLSLIPVPVVSSVAGAIVDGISEAYRSYRHGEQKDAAEAAQNKADLAKFELKELTVENLDRYRWKVAHAFESLNGGISEFNKKAAKDRTCDDVYAMALLIEQVERRKLKLRQELKQFNLALKHVNQWIAELESTQAVNVRELKEELKKGARETINTYGGHKTSDQAEATRILNEHANCEKWCCVKETAKYDPNSWPNLKSRIGAVSLAVAPVAVAALTVKAGDYQYDSSNSSMS